MLPRTLRRGHRSGFTYFCKKIRMLDSIENAIEDIKEGKLVIKVGIERPAAEG